jgi:hypothetical protein
MTGKVKFKKKAASLVHGRVLRQLRECGIGHPGPNLVPTAAPLYCAGRIHQTPWSRSTPTASGAVMSTARARLNRFERPPSRTDFSTLEWMENFAGLQFLDSKQHQFQADRTYVRRCVHAIMTRRECTCQCSPFYTLRLDNLGAASLTVTRFANSFDTHRGRWRS